MSRMQSHTDWSTLTLLFQDDCGGLQVEDPKSPGHFIDVPPVPDTLVMNVGDLLMRWSNGKSMGGNTSRAVSRPTTDLI
jgi:isopenicillin N synthase-like dioxygenase